MGLFDFLKKKKADVKINYTLNDLEKGYLVDYFMKTWEVKRVYTYDWGNNFISKEYFIDAGNERSYLSVEDDDELICSLWSKIAIEEVNANLVNLITKDDEAPDRLDFKGKTYYRKESSMGMCYQDDNEEGSELVNWMYVEPTTKELLSIDRWGEEEYGAAIGKYVKEFEFSNILPR